MSVAGPAGLTYRRRGLYLESTDTLVVADLHVGRDRTSNVALPVGERADLTDRLGALVERFDPGTVVLAGDVLHSFSTVPDGVETTLKALRGTVRRAGADLVAVRGNHDGMLPSLSAIDAVVDAYRLADGTLVVHGHERPPVPAPRYVGGHDHPALRIDGQRRPVCLFGERVFPRSRVDNCGDPVARSDANSEFDSTSNSDPDSDASSGSAAVVGGADWTGDPGALADVVMLPAFSGLAPGTVCNAADGRDLQSPLVEDLDRFRPAVFDEEGNETLWFPPLGEFRRLL